MPRTALAVLAVALFTASCGGDALEPFGPAAPFEAGQAVYAAVAAEDAAAFAARDAEALRALYVPDIVIVDGDGSADGIDELVSIAEFIWAQFPEYGEAHTATYVGSADGIVVMEQWGWEGFTEDDRLYEYRIIEVTDGVITAWEAVYDMDTRPYFGRGGADEEVLALRDFYLESWGSRDPELVGWRYIAAAVRHDPLFDEPASGREAIEDLAAELFDRLPGYALEVQETIGLRSHVREDVGMVVSITWDAEPACAVEAVIWMEADKGFIVRERIYYDVASLIACGWVGEE